MEILYYKNLDFKIVQQKFFQVLEVLKNGNFSGADVKKMPQTGLYRAKLDYDTRLLFKIAKYNGQSYLLLLEIIRNHDYASSRFLRGIHIDENKLLPIQNIERSEQMETVVMPYVNSRKPFFHLLDKILSFDDGQEEILHLPLPLIIIGSAGSGKTAMSLEKIKMLKGNILYVTLSPFLVENAARLYYSHNYENENQEVDFLSFREFMASMEVPQGREIDFRAFEQWFLPHRHSSGIKDAYKLFEEFKGVITGGTIDKEFLSCEEYLNLGVKQSIFLVHERTAVYGLFEKYLRFLKENHYYDANMLAHRWLALCKQRYDFVIVDEVQDITNIQLYLILQSLKQKQEFILCGDSNQIVHPNFFSWSKIKTMFYLNQLEGNGTRILSANYRNSRQVTELANKLLKIKNARFGSIDKESTYLIDSVSEHPGEAMLLNDHAEIKNEFNQKTKKSARFAILVMRNEDKTEARKFFNTPLIFSIQEAKGLEYENILLLNFISGNDKEFREITRDVTTDHLLADDLRYARAADKTDKSLEAYKFYINSLYVAITRAIRNVYILEQNSKHELLFLLGLMNTQEKLDLQQQSSTHDEWQREAQRLEKQGRSEQAELIRKTILGTQPVPWRIISTEELENLKKEALDPETFNKKAKDLLFDYALIYNDEEISKELFRMNYKRAQHPETERPSLLRRTFVNYVSDNPKPIMPLINKYGVDFRNEFNQTPLMIAAWTGSVNIANYLLALGAKTELRDNLGKNALQTVFLQSYFSKDYAKNKLAKIYPLVVTEYVNVKVDNHLVKINNHKTEFQILNLLMATQKELIAATIDDSDKAFGFTAGEVADIFEAYPDTILPPYRKQKQYISAVLARNEVRREDPYNKKLFMRLERGIYVLNPELEIQTGEQWLNVYRLMNTEKMTCEQNDKLMKMRLNGYLQFFIEEEKQINEIIGKEDEKEFPNREKISDLNKRLFSLRKVAGETVEKIDKLENKTTNKEEIEFK